MSAVNQQIQEILDAKESNWQKFVRYYNFTLINQQSMKRINPIIRRRLGPKHESINEIYKSALVSSVGVESG